MQDIWLIVGATSSVARAFARAAAGDGADLVLLGRDGEDMAATAADVRLRTGRDVAVVACDVAATATHRDVAATCWAIAGGRRLNVFIAAGVMPPQDAALRDVAVAERIFAVNFTGIVSLLTQLLPGLVDQGGGTVMALGSVAGDRGRRKNFVYGAAKAGLHAYLQGLRSHLLASGVRVVTIKPGFLDTAMTWGVPGMFLVASPERAARACLKAAAKGRDEVYVPGFWRLVMMVIRSIPEPLFKRLSI